MANNQGEGFGDDLFEQIVLQVPGYTTTTTTGGGLEPTGFLGFRGGLGGGGRGGSNEAPSSSSSSSSSMMLGLGSSTGDGPSGHHHHHHQRHGLNVGLGVGVGGGGGGFRGLSLPLGLNLDHGVAGNRFGDGGDGAINVSSSSSPRISDGDTVNFTNLFPAFGPIQPHFLRPVPPPASIQLHPQPSFQGHAAAPPQPSRAAPHAPGIRPRVRARRGQATDPHSIAERLRRERIAERMKALQELVPSCNKTDRAAMLDEIVDYVKFLKLQVKVLSMSRLGGAGAVAQLVADVPTTSSIEGLGGGGMEEQPAWEKWSNDGTEQQVARLMDQDIGAAMQLLQSKSLCIMPLSVASTMFPAHPPPVSDSTTPTIIKPESGHP